jgi:hypothetical protein
MSGYIDWLLQIYFEAPLAAKTTSSPILNYMFVAMMICTEYHILHLHASYFQVDVTLLN